MFINGKCVVYVNVFKNGKDSIIHYSSIVNGGKDAKGKNKPNGFIDFKFSNDMKDYIVDTFGIEKVKDFPSSFMVDVKKAFLSYEEFEKRNGDVASKFVVVVTDCKIIDNDESDEEEIKPKTSASIKKGK